MTEAYNAKVDREIETLRTELDEYKVLVDNADWEGSNWKSRAESAERALEKIFDAWLESYHARAALQPAK